MSDRTKEILLDKSTLQEGRERYLRSFGEYHLLNSFIHTIDALAKADAQRTRLVLMSVMFPGFLIGAGVTGDEEDEDSVTAFRDSDVLRMYSTQIIRNSALFEVFLVEAMANSLVNANVPRIVIDATREFRDRKWLIDRWTKDNKR